MAFYKCIILAILAATSSAKLAFNQNADYQHIQSAATPSQIKYAIEQKYDETGPGAKIPETAYKTFKTAEEAERGYAEYDNKLFFQPYSYSQEESSLPIQESPQQQSLPYGVYNNYDGIAQKYYSGTPQKLYTSPVSPVVTTYVADEGTDISGFARPEYESGYVRGVGGPKQSGLNSYELESSRTGGSDAPFDHNPIYSFSYGVNDHITGDTKSHVENRHGDTVSGYYSLVDADGHQRTVSYSADDKNGFNAVVHRTPYRAN